MKYVSNTSERYGGWQPTDDCTNQPKPTEPTEVLQIS